MPARVANVSNSEHLSAPTQAAGKPPLGARLVFVACFCFLLFWISHGFGDVIIYQTSFEAGEGYKTNLHLGGQNGWVQAGTGGNGILSGFFPGKGQQGYIGLAPPATNDSSLFLYQPINKTLPYVRFSVTMAVADSSNTNYDDFYWSVYNQQGHALVTLDFDNYYLEVFYWLDGTNSRAPSGLLFTNGVAYPVTMDLDFVSNRWSATFNGQLVTNNQPITTVGAPLNLGDIDAGWIVYSPAAPGDNYMVFDDYLITASLPPPQLSVLGTVAGATALRLSGQPDMTFVIEASTNLANWTALKTNVTTGGYFDFIDVAAATLPARFYRGRWVP